MKIYLRSCHATLEYDMALMFTRKGWEVKGMFDIGNTERPKIKGVTDTTTYRFKDCDVLIADQSWQPPLAKILVETAPVMYPKPVIGRLFGQGMYQDYQILASIADYYKNVYLVCYSLKEAGLLKFVGKSDRYHFIRFGKDLSVYKNRGYWKGTHPFILVTGNSIHKRGEGCGYHILQQLQNRGLPFILAGNETEEVGGLGRISYEALLTLYQQAYCMLSLGTYPAPLVLSLIEAMCMGTPVVAYDNLGGVANEELEIPIERNIDQLEKILITLLEDKAYREELSKKEISKSEAFFDSEKIVLQWEEFFKETNL